MQLSNYGEFPASLPVIVEDDLFLYPFMISPIFLTDTQNIEAANIALEDNSLVLVVPVKNNLEGERNFDSIHNAGVIGSVMRKVTLPDGRIKILFQGLAKGEILERISENPLNAVVGAIEMQGHNELKVNATLEILREKVRTLSTTSDLFPPDLLKTIEENHEPNRIVDLIASTIKLKREQAYKLFTDKNLEERLFMLIEFIAEEINAAKLQREIKSKVHSRIEKVNKEYFLKEQLKQIRQELGDDTQRDEEIEEYRQKLEDKKPFMDADAHKEVNKQIDRFARMHPDSADANLIQGYLDWVLEIPFGKYSKKKLDIHQVKKQLDADHYSLEKPKERIEEYFAVKELKEKRG
ncbi:MAG TPA: endopeptidase La, partial [Campylobacterales bacterium]|nr:endopeptidase La [Campylobacterales bacterium]